MEACHRFLAFVLILTIGITQSGCSMFVPTRERFSVTASEPDAKIYVNGDYLGKGNVETRVQRNKDVSVLVKKEGYTPKTKSIGTNFSMAGVLDIIGGCLILVPFLGLFFPGCRELEQTNVAVALEKEEPGK